MDGTTGCKVAGVITTLCTISNDAATPIVNEKVNFLTGGSPKLVVKSSIDEGQLLIRFTMTLLNSPAPTQTITYCFILKSVVPLTAPAPAPLQSTQTLSLASPSSSNPLFESTFAESTPTMVSSSSFSPFVSDVSAKGVVSLGFS